VTYGLFNRVLTNWSILCDKIHQPELMVNAQNYLYSVNQTLVWFQQDFLFKIISIQSDRRYCNLCFIYLDLNLTESFQKILSKPCPIQNNTCRQLKPLVKRSYHPQKSLKIFRFIFQYLHRLNHITCCFFYSNDIFKSFAKRNTVLATYYLMFFLEHYK
jgi:hypothetical protein